MTHGIVMSRRFLIACWAELRLIWPILSGLAGAQVLLGVVVGLREDWSAGEAIYFSLVTGLTIGYGDLVPLHFSTRLISICIGFIGILTTGLVAAISVRALQEVTASQKAVQPHPASDPPERN
jgi:Ion channel